MRTPCVDHKGVAYPSKRAMCRAYGIAPEAFDGRMARGWTLERALEGGIGKCHPKAMRVTAPDGTEYASVSAMCRALGLRKSVVKNRLKSGWSVERAVSEPIAAESRGCEDHEGSRYPDFAAMCRAWGRVPSTVRRRLSQGATLESALTDASSNGGPRRTTDHAGREFRSAVAFAKAYGLDPSSAQALGKNPGKDALCAVLGNKLARGHKTAFGDVALMRRISGEFFLALVAGKECVMRLDAVLDAYFENNGRSVET